MEMQQRMTWLIGSDWRHVRPRILLAVISVSPARLLKALSADGAISTGKLLESSECNLRFRFNVGRFVF